MQTPLEVSSPIPVIGVSSGDSASSIVAELDFQSPPVVSVAASSVVVAEPASNPISVNMTSVARTLFECNHPSMHEHGSPRPVSITQPTVASSHASENLENAVLSRSNLHVTVEDDA